MNMCLLCVLFQKLTCHWMIHSPFVDHQRQLPLDPLPKGREVDVAGLVSMHPGYCSKVPVPPDPFYGLPPACARIRRGRPTHHNHQVPSSVSNSWTELGLVNINPSENDRAALSPGWVFYPDSIFWTHYTCPMKADRYGLQIIMLLY